MTAIDARSIPDGTTLETDLCIVGAGAAGITLARELARAQFRIALIESGGLRPDGVTQSLLQGQTTGYKTSRLDETRWNGFGGTTAVWLGACRPLDEIDFIEREWVPYSGWPFSKQHLDPYYQRAQSVCQLGEYRYEVCDWQNDSRPPLPLPPERVATHIFQISSPTRFGSAYRQEILGADNIRTYFYANVVEIDTSPNGQVVTGVNIATLRGNRLRLAARVVVLAAGGVEVPRLLLLSNRVRTRGLGNEHDLVGRFYNDHPRMTAGILGLVDAPRYRPLYSMHAARRNGQSTTVEGFLTISESLLARERMLRCAFHLPARWRSFPAFNSRAVDSVRQLVRGMRNGMYYGWPRHLLQLTAGADAVALTSYRYLRNSPDDGRRGLIFAAHSEQAPNPHSRVKLIDKRDRLGRRMVRVDWRLTELDWWTIRRGTQLLGEEVARAGIGRVQSWLDGKEIALRDGYHHMGTTRMHTSPTHGVVDADARVHGTSNLYIASSAVFPTGGYANPTLTIVAMAIRLADHLKILFK